MLHAQIDDDGDETITVGIVGLEADDDEDLDADGDDTEDSDDEDWDEDDDDSEDDDDDSEDDALKDETNYAYRDPPREDE
jgi:hypothetical protein